MAVPQTRVALGERIRDMTPISAPPEQRAEVRALSDALERLSQPSKKAVPKCKLVGPAGESISIPESVFYVLERVAEVMAAGDSVSVVPVGKELTTQQAADLLNVSRQYLVRLLNEGRIAFTRTGKHRRIRIGEVLAFKESRDKERLQKLQALTRLSEEIGGYDKEFE